MPVFTLSFLGPFLHFSWNLHSIGRFPGFLVLALFSPFPPFPRFSLGFIIVIWHLSRFLKLKVAIFAVSAVVAMLGKVYLYC